MVKMLGSLDHELDAREATSLSAAREVLFNMINETELSGGDKFVIVDNDPDADEIE
jgi:hypothetical protein